MTQPLMTQPLMQPRALHQRLLLGLLGAILALQATAAHAELVVVVNPHASFNALTQGELRRIFLGETGNFPDGTAAVPLDVTSDDRTTFYQTILKKSPEAVENYWANMIFTGKAEPPRQVAANEVKQLVATSPRAISYIDRAQVDTSVKIINIVSGQ